jgi:hypothetical protein
MAHTSMCFWKDDFDLDFSCAGFFIGLPSWARFFGCGWSSSELCEPLIGMHFSWRWHAKVGSDDRWAFYGAVAANSVAEAGFWWMEKMRFRQHH